MPRSRTPGRRTERAMTVTAMRVHFRQAGVEPTLARVEAVQSERLHTGRQARGYNPRRLLTDVKRDPH